MLGGRFFLRGAKKLRNRASAGAAIIARIIAGIRIFFTANSFRIFAPARPNRAFGAYTHSRG